MKLGAKRRRESEERKKEVKISSWNEPQVYTVGEQFESREVAGEKMEASGCGRLVVCCILRDWVS